MSVLVLAEHNNQSLKEATKKALTAALKIFSPAHVVVIG
jgi:electron transfer flavoprotein alpha subunit